MVRGIWIVGITMLGFGIVLWWADKIGLTIKVEQWTLLLLRPLAIISAYPHLVPG